MVAANAVAVMVVNIGAIACHGFANATTIIISQELGKDHKDTAREYGKRMLRITIIVDSIFMWLVAVPLTFLGAYVLKLPPVWVYFIMTLDEFEKMPVVFIHYFRNKWLTNITRDFD